MVGVQLRGGEPCLFFWLCEGVVALYTPCILVTFCLFINISCFTYQKKKKKKNYGVFLMRYYLDGIILEG